VSFVTQTSRSFTFQKIVEKMSQSKRDPSFNFN